MAIAKENEDQEALLSESDATLTDKLPRVTPWAPGNYLRMMLDIIMVLLIVGLSILHFSDRKIGRPSPVPNFPLKSYTFLENPRYLHEDMFDNRTETLHTLHNWIELSADGRGYVKIDNPKSFGLGEPYVSPMSHDASKEEPVYMVSVFHQLHCLSYLVAGFQAANEGTGLEQEIAHHTAHCFDYLRQSIMCAADTSLEGKAEVGPGWGSEHVCKDYDAVLEWANSHDVYKWRTNMPGEAIL